MHGYCVEALCFSEHQAYERVTAARVARRFPAALAMLREGALHLTGLAMLAPHLTEENEAELLGKARHLSKRRIEELLADWRPKADKPDRVRPVAPPKAKIEPLGPAQKPAFMTLAPTPQPAQAVERRHAITFTATERVKQKLDRARALASHRLRSQRVEAVLEL